MEEGGGKGVITVFILILGVIYKEHKNFESDFTAN